MNKKAQSQIITTVLIILLVLAAIVIVWQVVRNTVETGAGGISESTDCMTIDLEILGNTSTALINVQRKIGTGDLGSIKVIMNGTVVTESAPYTAVELGTQAISTTNVMAKGDKIEIAPMLKSGKQCEIVDEWTVA